MVRPYRDKLSGKVEVDETYVGGEKPGKRGRGALGKSLVMITAEIDGNRIGRIRLRHVPDASAESLEEASPASRCPGQCDLYQGWKGYCGLNSLGYTHEVVRHTEEVGDKLLPYCHRVAALLKRWMEGMHQGAISHEHLDYYLDEYTFRFNRRTSRYRGKLFYRLLQQAIVVDPVSYSFLIKHSRGLKSRDNYM